MYSGEKQYPRFLPKSIMKRHEKGRGLASTSTTAHMFEPVKVIAPVEVIDENFNVIFSCRQVESPSKEMHLERLPGSLSLNILEEGTKVLLRTYTSDLKELQKHGTVKSSTRTLLIIDNLEDVQLAFNRSTFRQPLNVKGELYDSVDDYMKTPKECLVLNISANGACVSSEYAYMESQPVILRLEIYPGAGPSSFKGEIIREVYKGSYYEYGILFEQLTSRKLHDLEADLEEVRHIILKKTYV